MNENLCKQGYNDVVEFTARLAAYSTASFIDLIGHGEYETRAQELAIRDIVFLCISLRRLVEITKQYKPAKERWIPCYTAHRENEKMEFFESDKKFNLWETIGNIIHAKEIHLVKSDVDFSVLFSNKKRDIVELFHLMEKRMSINGIILLISDRGDIKTFEIYKFIKLIVQLTEDIEEYLSDNSIFVGSAYE